MSSWCGRTNCFLTSCQRHAALKGLIDYGSLCASLSGPVRSGRSPARDADLRVKLGIVVRIVQHCGRALRQTARKSRLAAAGARHATSPVVMSCAALVSWRNRDRELPRSWLLFTKTDRRCCEEANRLAAIEYQSTANEAARATRNASSSNVEFVALLRQFSTVRTASRYYQTC